MTKRDFKSEIENLHPNIEVLGEVVNGATKVLLKCSLDDYEWETRPYDLLRGHGCHACNGVPRYTTKSFKKALRKVNEEILVISEYMGAHKYIDYICKSCGEERSSKAYQLLAGRGCKKCGYVISANKNRKTLEGFKSEVFDLVGSEYEVFGEYKNTNEDIGFIHKKCGYKFQSIANNFLKGSRCPKCNGGVRKKDTNYFKSEVNEVTGGEYSFVGNYEGIHKNCSFKHNECGSVFRTTPSSFLHQGTRCPNCFFISKGELEVMKILKKKNIEFIQQKTFDDLRSVGKLRFDFFLPEFNLCIEYDGAQHFEVKEHWGGVEEFNNIKKRDAMKNKYCKDKGIGLLRIHYKETDIRGLVRECLDVQRGSLRTKRIKSLV